MKLKRIILVILIVIWSFIIFYASSRVGDDSDSSSKGVLYGVVKTSVSVTNKINITNIYIGDDVFLDKFVSKYNYPFRKLCHFSEYFILCLLIFLLLSDFNLSVSKVFFLSIGICFLYSLTDEFHQVFVPDRAGKFSDCLIDTSGAIVSSLFSLLFRKIKWLKSLYNNKIVK